MSDPPAQPHPRGVATAVVFDWALTVQLSTQAVAAATGHLGLARDPAAIAGRLLAAAVLLALGEALRRGVEIARLIQVAIVALITVLGLASAGVLLTGHGSGGLVLSVVIELTVAPFLAWALLSRGTSAWFAAVGRAQAPRASGRGWVLVLGGWSVAWGVVVAWTQSL